MKGMYVLHQSSSNMQVSQNFFIAMVSLKQIKREKKKKEQRETNDRVSKYCQILILSFSSLTWLVKSWVGVNQIKLKVRKASNEQVKYWRYHSQ